MTCEAKGNLRSRARTTTALATTVLVAGAYIVMSGTTAKPAAGADINEAGKEDKLIEAGASSNEGRKEGKLPSTSRAEPQYKEKYSADVLSSTTADPAASASSNEAGKEDKLVQDAFRPGPQYKDKYNADGQVAIYGGKTEIVAPRPLLELGREQYTSGDYGEQGGGLQGFLGEKNLLLPGLSVYGDWRTAVAFNSNAGKDVAQIATRLNLDVDYKITGTERVHAFFTPLQDPDNAKFTRFEFGGSDADRRHNFEYELNPQTLFFEGDVGSIYSGLSGQYASFDLPFTVGLFPLFLQNGIWANDAILGGAVSLTAKNSQKLGLSNYDITFFTAFDNVDNAGILGKNNTHDANLYGATTFIDAFGGYIEGGYGLIQGLDDRDGVLEHFLTASFTRRYGNTLSNSTRVFANFGDDPGGHGDGFAIISENSLVSSLPSTLLPYANFFFGTGNPQPLVDGNGAGILKNVGINFETDALTGFPKLNDTASNAYGGAIGLQYLFNLDQQLVFEAATVQPYGNPIAGVGAPTAEYGFGVRYQIPISQAWLFRADATYQIIEGGEDSWGIRTEVRRKF